MCLESGYASSEIHNWIDLIFGYKQSGKFSKEFLNVFCEATYEENFKKLLENKTDDEKESLVGQIYHFGQAPMCLFTQKPHPKKKEAKSTYLFERFLSFGGKNNKFKKLSKKNGKEGTPHAIFNLEKCIIIVESLDNSLYISKYFFTEPPDFIPPNFFNDLNGMSIAPC